MVRRSANWFPILAAAAAGVGLGALGRLSDYAPIPVRGLFNLGVPWLLAAMAAGAGVAGVAASRARLGAAAGAVLLVTAMGAYYAILRVVEGRGGGPTRSPWRSPGARSGPRVTRSSGWPERLCAARA